MMSYSLQQLGEKNFNLEADLEDREIAIQELEKNSDGLESDLNGKQALHEQVVTALKEVSLQNKSASNREFKLILFLKFLTETRNYQHSIKWNHNILRIFLNRS